MSTAQATEGPRPGPGNGLWSRLRSRVVDSTAAFVAIGRNKDLRRLQLAWVGSIIGSWAYGIALAVYAYRVGGPAAVGLAALIRTIPTAIASPFVAGLGDRYSRVRVMVISDVLRAALFAMATLAIVAGSGPAVVYILGALVLLAGTAFRPAQAAIMPKLTRGPEELAASNVVSTTIESVGFFAGPALAGILLVATSPEVVFAVSGLTCLWSGVLVATIRVPAEDGAPAAAPKERFVSEAVAGFKAVARESDLRVLVGLFTAQTLIAGALNVLVVVLALQMLETGEAGVGYLNAAVGVGGVVGAVVAAAMIGRGKLSVGFLAGNVLWGAPLVIIGLVPENVAAFLMLAAIGIGNTVVDVAGYTMLQRAVSDQVMARVFGVLETLLLASIGVGGILTPVIVSGLGERGAFIAIGAFLPILTALLWRRLAAMDNGADVPEGTLDLIQRVAFLRLLPAMAQERLAAGARDVGVPLGDVVFQQGEQGDRFYVVKSGAFDVIADEVRIGRLEPGDPFGEIALLRDVPRTAMVMAAKPDSSVLVIERDLFVPTVTGCAPSAAAANAFMSARLTTMSTRRFAI